MTQGLLSQIKSQKSEAYDAQPYPDHDVPRKSESGNETPRHVMSSLRYRDIVIYFIRYTYICPDPVLSKHTRKRFLF